MFEEFTFMGRNCLIVELFHRDHNQRIPKWNAIEQDPMNTDVNNNNTFFVLIDLHFEKDTVFTFPMKVFS